MTDQGNINVKQWVYLIRRHPNNECCPSRELRSGAGPRQSIHDGGCKISEQGIVALGLRETDSSFKMSRNRSSIILPSDEPQTKCAGHENPTRPKPRPTITVNTGPPPIWKLMVHALIRSHANRDRDHKSLVA